MQNFRRNEFVADDNVVQKTPFTSEIAAQSKEDRDVQVLAKLGKKSVLKVRSYAETSYFFPLIVRRDALDSYPSWVSCALCWLLGRDH